MKKYQTLLINSINPEMKGTTVERLTQVKKIFESEMLSINSRRDSYTIQERLQDWLQGLCNTIQIPFANYDIIQWLQGQLKRNAKSEHEEEKWLENYWPQCDRTLYELLYL